MSVPFRDELRAPLTSIIGYVEILHDGGLDADQARGAGGDRAQLDPAPRAGRDLLTSADGRRQGPEPAPIHFGPIIESAVTSVLPAAVEQGVEVTALVPADLPPVWADPDHADRIVLNLLWNASSSHPARSRRDLRGRHAEGVSVVVRDDGIGIPPTSRCGCSNRSSRGADATTQGIQGTGLGLFIVEQAWSELHDGTVTLLSALGKGTSVTITLPIVPAAS